MKQLILTLSSGRCGTTRFGSLLKRVPNLYSDEFTNVPLGEEDMRFDYEFRSKRQSNRKDPSIGYTFIKDKLEIYQNLPYDNFVITDHVALDGFIEHFISLYSVPNIIVLRRPIREVASSLFRLNWIPGKSPTQFVSFPGPQEDNVLPYFTWKKAHSYQLCFWYCCHVEWKIQQWLTHFARQGSLIWETTLAQILDLNHFNNMMKFFGLSTVDTLPQEKVNHYEIYKSEISVEREIPPANFLEKLEREVLENIPPDIRVQLETYWRTQKSFYSSTI